MTADIWQLGGATLLVLLAGLFSAADASLAGFSRARAEELRAEGRPGAVRLIKILDDPARYLNTAGVSGKGMISFFKKLQQQEYGYGLANIDPFMQSHPLSGERIANLTNDLQTAPAWNAKPDAALEERFKRVKAKLQGYVATPERTLAQRWLAARVAHAAFLRSCVPPRIGGDPTIPAAWLHMQYICPSGPGPSSIQRSRRRRRSHYVHYITI